MRKLRAVTKCVKRRRKKKGLTNEIYPLQASQTYNRILKLNDSSYAVSAGEGKKREKKERKIKAQSIYHMFMTK